MQLTSATTITSTELCAPPGLALPSIPVIVQPCAAAARLSGNNRPQQYGPVWRGQFFHPHEPLRHEYAAFGNQGGTSTDQYTNIATTTTTAISATGAPGATATGYKEEIELTLVNSATGADVVTIYALTGNALDAVVIEPGSSCEWLP